MTDTGMRGVAMQDTSSISPESIAGALGSVIDATSTLATDVQALGRPETESGQEAQQTVTELADTAGDRRRVAAEDARHRRWRGPRRCARPARDGHPHARLHGQRRRPGIPGAAEARAPRASSRTPSRAQTPATRSCPRRGRRPADISRPYSIS